jgi:hypothetical protein
MQPWQVSRFNRELDKNNPNGFLRLGNFFGHAMPILLLDGMTKNMSIERELGQIGQSLQDLNRGQEHIIKQISDVASTTKAELAEHRRDDKEAFDEMRKTVGGINWRIAVISGGFAVVVAVMKLFL